MDLEGQIDRVCQSQRSVPEKHSIMNREHTCQEVQVSGPVFLARHGSVNLIKDILHVLLQ